MSESGQVGSQVAFFSDDNYWLIPHISEESDHRDINDDVIELDNVNARIDGDIMEIRDGTDMSRRHE